MQKRTKITAEEIIIKMKNFQLAVEFNSWRMLGFETLSPASLSLLAPTARHSIIFMFPSGVCLFKKVLRCSMHSSISSSAFLMNFESEL